MSQGIEECPMNCDDEDNLPLSKLILFSCRVYVYLEKEHFDIIMVVWKIIVFVTLSSLIKIDDECCVKLGMLVHSEQEAYDLYNQYALGKGFSIRRDGVRYKHGTKVVREKTYVCNKAGLKLDSKEDQPKSRQHLNTRTDCKAFVSFKVEIKVEGDVQGEDWSIVRFSDEHNHELAPPEHRHLLKSGRKIPDATKGVIESMVDSCIGPTKARAYIAKQVGGVKNIPFTMQDCHNHVQSRKKILIGPMDAQTLFNHFKLKQAQDPMFFYTPYLDSEGRLANVFWRDGESKLDYDCFKDVVIFDTTFRTNKYNMICAPFVGINHHWQNVLLGCAFLQDETIQSFKWAVRAFLDAMGGKAPQTIFTDQDQAMAAAIAEVFPATTVHRLCDWHIAKNAAKQIPHLYGKADFKKKFNKCFYACYTIDEFESTWKEMIEEWNASDNKWLKTLYGLKKKWCPAFSLDVFSANVKSTQRSESMNNVFHHVTRKTMTLTEFVMHYEECVEKQREAETYEDFRNNQGKPILRVFVGLLNHASNVYTCKIFNMFLKEFDNAVAENIIECRSDDSFDYYTLQREGFQRKHIVQFRPLDVTISCSCKKFESMGILCRHILRVLNVKTNISKIPERYIAKRWTKCAKEGMIFDGYNKEIIRTNSKESKTIRMNELMRKAFFAMNLAAFDEKTSSMAKVSIEQLVKNVKNYKGTLEVSCDSRIDSISVEPNTVSMGVTWQNPPSLRPKGETNARIKSREEKRQKKTANVVPRPMQRDTFMEGQQRASVGMVSSRAISSSEIPSELPTANAILSTSEFLNMAYSNMLESGSPWEDQNYIDAYNFE